jgi:hypothetical protein
MPGAIELLSTWRSEFGYADQLSGRTNFGGHQKGGGVGVR